MTSYNDFTISNSIKRDDYEILIRQKRGNAYMAYCPQLNHIIKGTSFDEVYSKIDEFINEHINMLTSE